MTDEPSVTGLLAEVRNELRVARTIPSTGIVLRQRAVNQAVDYILSDSRFDTLQVSLHNGPTLTAALQEVSLDGRLAEFGVYKGTSLTQIAKFVGRVRLTNSSSSPRVACSTACERKCQAKCSLPVPQISVPVTIAGI